MAITYAKNSCLIKTPPVIEIGNGVYTLLQVGNYIIMAEELHENLGTLNTDYVIGSTNGKYYYKGSSILSLLSSYISDGWMLPGVNFFRMIGTAANGLQKIAGNAGSSWPGTNETGLNFLPLGTAETYNNTPQNTDACYLNPGSGSSLSSMGYSASYNNWYDSNVSYTSSRCYPVRLYRTIS